MTKQFLDSVNSEGKESMVEKPKSITSKHTRNRLGMILALLALCLSFVHGSTALEPRSSLISWHQNPGYWRKYVNGDRAHDYDAKTNTFVERRFDGRGNRFNRRWWKEVNNFGWGGVKYMYVH